MTNKSLGKAARPHPKATYRVVHGCRTTTRGDSHPRRLHAAWPNARRDKAVPVSRRAAEVPQLRGLPSTRNDRRFRPKPAFAKRLSERGPRSMVDGLAVGPSLLRCAAWPSSSVRDRSNAGAGGGEREGVRRRWHRARARSSFATRRTGHRERGSRPSSVGGLFRATVDDKTMTTCAQLDYGRARPM